MAIRIKKKRKAKPPNPRPKIEYPPVPTRTWIPPDERPKKKKPPPKYVKPQQISVKLELSSLQRVWHNFTIIGDRAILTGSYSQYYKKYIVKSAGYQAPCNCVVAVAFSKLFDITDWSASTLDKILDTGDYLYLRTLSMLVPDKEKKILKLSEVYHTYYIDSIKVTMDMKGKKYSGKILPDLDDTPHLAEILKEFFETQQSGVLVIGQRFFALFVVKKGFYLFDPTDHESDGTEWTGLQGHGRSLLARVVATANLVPLVRDNLKCADNPRFTLVPCNILRKFEINTNFPSCMEDANLELKFPPTKDKQIEYKRSDSKGELATDVTLEDEETALEKADEEEEEDEDALDVNLEESPDGTPRQEDGGQGDPADRETTGAVGVQTKKKPEARAPVEKVKAASVTYFIDVVPEKVKILRASTHQCDTKFTKYPGKQGIANAVAAIGMLRIHKSKYWTSNILDEILKLGEVIYHDSMKSLRRSENATLKVTTVCKTFSINESEFTPKIEDLTIVGKLNSQTDDMLDLLPALKEFFADNDACILNGPLVLALWMENQSYYMFDPNERDNSGLAIVKQVQIGSFLKVYDVLPGVACITWYTSLRDLVATYMKNVPKEQRREQFVLCKIQIEDYFELPEAWNCFECLSMSKWILKGNFCQNSRRYSKETRNTQCTAMAAIAIAMKEIKPIKEWNSETLDEVLDFGDKYYESCINHLKDKDAFVSKLLMIIELLPKYIMNDKELCFEMEECLVNGNLSYPDNHEIPNLKMGFRQFFEDSDAGILTCRNVSMAIWKKDEVFYYFDSHSKNDQGLTTYYGTSMVIRVLTIEELTKVVLANLGPNTNSQYNIGRVAVKIVEAGEGIPKPPLNNFKEIDENKAILRSTTSEDDPKFKINSGKQTVPNAIAALGMTQVYPVAHWTRDVMDEVLNIGDRLYVESMEAQIEAEEKKKEEMMQPVAPPPPPPPPVEEPEPVKGKKGKVKKEEAPPPPPPPPEPEPVVVEEDEDSDDITSSKVAREFMIGVNKFQVDLELLQEGTHEGLQIALNDAFPPPPVPEEPSLEVIEQADGETTTVRSANVPSVSPEPEAAAVDEVKKPLLLESDVLTLIMWKEDGLYYVFDPKPRDPSGQVYGKDEWSTLPEPESSESGSAEGDAKSIDEESKIDDSKDVDLEVMSLEIPEDKLQIKKTAQAEQNAAESVDAMPSQLLDEEGREAMLDFVFGDEYEGEDEIEDIETVKAAIPKHSPSYWREQEKAGKACAIRFLTSDDMIRHIIENVPPTKADVPFKLTQVTIASAPKVKDIYDPELGPPADKYSGDWKNFKEIDHGRWILRGTMNDMNEMFPCINRGRQFVAISFISLAFVTLYSIPKFTARSVDDIVMYGDRLHSFTLNQRRKELKELRDLDLTDSEVDAVVKVEEMGIMNTGKHFCISTDKVKLEIEMDVAQGEIDAQELEDEMDVKRGLETFFHGNKMGILTARDILVAVWRRGPIFYMFDPHSRGPSGFACVNGVACITRYLNLGDLVEVFLHNLSKEGDHRFFVHAVTLTLDHCPREEARKKKPKLTPNEPITSFLQVVPGKTIVRGSISQDHQTFGRRLNSQFGPMAFVALAMTLVHRCMFWTKPIVDEIVRIGDQVYGTALDDLGFEFNPWEQTLTLDDTPTDFKIGGLKVNCEVRPYDQRGIVNIKNSNILNLRQGLEKFFEENSHGVIDTESLTLAIWEEDEPQKTYYMFDPCARGPTGMPLADGAACVVTFDSAKRLADHFMSLTPDHQDADFIIRPVEVVVGKMKTKGKKKKKKGGCGALSDDLLLGRRKILPGEKNQKLLMTLVKQLREEQRMAKLGRKRFYNIPGTETAILRGSRHQGSNSYSTYSRGNQDIPICLASYVMERLLPFEKWSYKIIDMVLDVGDQLYKDSFVLYAPKDKKLGLKCVLREIVIKEALVEIAIGRPVLISQFTQCRLETALELCFRQKNYCMICVNDQYVALFCKDETYYAFDPHAIALDAKPKEDGRAAVLKFKSLNALTKAVVENYENLGEEVSSVFSIILVAIKSIRKMPKCQCSTTSKFFDA